MLSFVYEWQALVIVVIIGQTRTAVARGEMGGIFTDDAA